MTIRLKSPHASTSSTAPHRARVGMRHGRAGASTDEPFARATTDEPAGTSGDAGRFEYEIALGSSGWLFVYYVGVVKALRERGMARCEGCFDVHRRGVDDVGRARRTFGRA